MSFTCIVSTCKNHSTASKSGDDLCFYSFPQDSYRFLQWEKAVGVGAGTLSGQTIAPHICSNHFDRNAYRLQDILLKVPIGKRRLVDEAVPTLNLPQIQAPVDTQKEMEQITERRRIVGELLEQHGMEQEARKQKRGHKSTQTVVDHSRDVSVLSKQLDAVAWKLGQQQSTIFQLQRQLERFRQFFTPEEADLIAVGEMVPKSSEAVTYKVQAYDETDTGPEMPLEGVFFEEEEEYIVAEEDAMQTQ